MKDIFSVLQDLATQFRWHIFAGLLTLLATYFGAFKVVWGLICKLWNFRKQRKLQQDLHPFYSPREIEDALQYYVETQCQNIPPSKENEPGETHAFATREPIIPFFLKHAFKSNDDTQYYIVLADSGMGKTTFMINLYLRYLHQFQGTKYQIRLFPLGWKDVDTN